MLKRSKTNPCSMDCSPKGNHQTAFAARAATLTCSTSISHPSNYWRAQRSNIAIGDCIWGRRRSPHGLRSWMKLKWDACNRHQEWRCSGSAWWSIWTPTSYSRARRKASIEPAVPSGIARPSLFESKLCIYASFITRQFIINRNVDCELV